MCILTNISSYLVINFYQNYNLYWIYLPSASVLTRQKSSSELSKRKADAGRGRRMKDAYTSEHFYKK